MWIKWKYNDHGAGGWNELEVPTETGSSGRIYYGGEESVEDYICELSLVPTWSERFTKGRIEWRKIKQPSKDTIKKLIDDQSYRSKKAKLEKKRLSELLNNL